MIASVLKHRKGMFLLLSAVIFTVICINLQTQEKANIVQAFKNLDQMDLKFQSSLNSRENISKDISQIYGGQQLTKAKAYFEDLKAKKLRLKIRSVEYKQIKVLQYNSESAVLLVGSRYDGEYVNVGSSGETLGKLGIDLLCQVEMEKEDGKWKIFNIVMLRDEPLET